ncbi:MAG: LysR family transcriptional regulator [Rhodocyclaceae bacterium]|nr:LysR family transcriptional regulator [Rhodocyclaceae bacterium]MBX3669271.1 LysR family transcriptional regulator [Rhodocyclaceae bacterium]
MEIYKLRTFAAVAELGQLTRAAERLHLSQPAVTAQVKALEEELQLGLFERTPAGMVLTEAGRRMLVKAEKVLQAAQELRNEAAHMRGAIAGKFSLGAVADPELIRLGDLVNLALGRHPLVEIEIFQNVSGEALEGVRKRTLDASFYFGDLNVAGVAAMRLRDIVYCVTGPAAWKKRLQNAEWDDIAAMPWVFAPTVSTHRKMVEGLFRSRSTVPGKVVEADQEALMSSLVIAGMGLGLMREDQARAAVKARDVVIWPKARCETTLWFIYLADREREPVIKALLDAVRTVWSSEKPAVRAVDTDEAS